MKIYLDVCCLNRPFDDQTQDRIHLESEAVLAILKNLDGDNWIWISSSVVLFEVNQAPNLDRRRRLLKLCEQASSIVKLDEEIFAAAETLKKSGFRSYDALHLACARSSA
jgi:predicted nucleic acid-binding protein